MQNIHNELYVLSGQNDPLHQIAKSLSQKYRIIFIDEFQVEDVSDAMIIGKLLNLLSASQFIRLLPFRIENNDIKNANYFYSLASWILQ